MAERVIIRQDKEFQTSFSALDPEEDQVMEFHPIEQIHQLTPYGMLLSSLGSCTALVLHTYAQNHDIPLEAVELQLDYQRVFREDCEDCDQDKEYTEEILEAITLFGDLSERQRQKLMRVVSYCPIHRMLDEGIRIKTNFNPQD